MNLYNLSLHWKQGDDLAHFYKKAKDPKIALLSWATFMEKNAKTIRNILKIFKYSRLLIDVADTHTIILAGNEKCLEIAAKKKYLRKEEDDEKE